LYGTRKLERRLFDKRLVCACLGFFAFLFQVLTPVALQAQNVNTPDLPSEFRIICSAYGLITLPDDKADPQTSLTTFCPYCQLQQISHNIAPKGFALPVSVAILHIKQTFIHRIEPAAQRHARLATPRSPPSNLI
jgi:hypothetical protein